MKIAVIGSRNLHVENLEDYLTQECTEIVSGGAKGIDKCAAKYAKAHDLKLTEFLPQYGVYRRAAPIVRNKQIVDYAESVIRYCEKAGKPCKIILLEQEASN